MAKFLLNIPAAMYEFSRLNGAQFKKDIGWYYIGDFVPFELEDFVVKQDRQQSMWIRQCPKCGSQMKLRESKTGNIFWGCMSFPSCLGTREIEPEDENHLKQFGSLITNRKKNSDHRTSMKSMPESKAWIAEKLLVALGNPEKIEKWLTTSKVSLGGRKPIELLGSKEGCEIVARMLEQLI